ncbi:MAG: hypothetical protein GX946_09200 [Oligosphaeraceae bacterium]|nr:hypothetical protein [Oligosphaeraceae bacterium]
MDIVDGTDIVSTKSTPPPTFLPQFSANAALTLLAVACVLLDRQVARLATYFETAGSFAERLYRIRTNNRRNQL